MNWILRALSPARRWPVFVAILIGLFLARGALYLTVMPPFAGCDEYQHLGYLVYLHENGKPPVYGESTVPRSLLARMTAFPHPPRALEQIPGSGAQPYETYWAQEEVGGDRPPPDVALYQAQHGSLYYRLVLPVFNAAGGIDDLPRAVAWLRAVNLLCVAIAMWLVLGRVGQWVRSRAVVGLVGIAVSWQPFFLGTACRVANDAPGMLFGTIAIVLITSKWRPSVAWAIVVGLVIGAGALLKSVNLALVPFAGMWALCAVYRRGPEDTRASLGTRLGVAAVVVVTALAVMGPTIWGNVERYGTPTSMQEAILNKRAGHGWRDLLDTARGLEWHVHFRDLWTRMSLWSGGWSELRLPRLLRHSYLYLLAFSFVGLIGALLRPRTRDGGAWVAILLIVSFSLALSVHMVHTQLAWGGVATDARYAAAVLPWLVAGALAAAAGWGRMVQGGLAFAFGALFLVAEARGFVGEMVPEYAALRFGGEALDRIARLQPAILGVETFWIAAVVAIVLVVAVFGLALFAVANRDRDPATEN